MEIIDLNTWEEYLSKINDFRKTNEECKKSERHASQYLFRGQPDAEFELLTTLDRMISTHFSLKRYYHIIDKIKGQIDSFIGNKLPFPEYKEMIENLKKMDVFLGYGFFGYEYMIYLRHHGFPSPLLDWTYSPYIAAFFAFKDKCMASKIAIYTYREYAGNGKAYSSDKPFVKALGPYVTSHKRHYLQQSNYTICVKVEKDNHFFEKHETAIESLDWQGQRQDFLTKITLPISERKKALDHLNSMNINAFSLFGSEESLMHTLGISCFVTDFCE
jgi:hypothetical protein